LLEDAKIRQGLQFWDKHGPEVDFELLPTAHDRIEALDEWVDLHAKATELGEAGGTLFLEWISDATDTDNLTAYLGEVAAAPKFQLGLAILDIQRRVNLGKLHPFMGRVAVNIASTNANIAIPDFTLDGDRPADRVLQRWSREEKRLGHRYVLKGGEALDELVIPKRRGTVVGYDHTRDLNFVGNMGSKLAETHQPGQTSHAKFLVGAAHVNVARHLQTRGVPVAVPDLSAKPLSDWARKHISWITNVKYTP
jgi:hypothetical protein